MAGLQVVQINDNSWTLDGGIGRAFVYKGTEKVLLVDTTAGVSDGDFQPVDVRAEVEKIADGLPIVLVNTHGDGDHIGCNHQFETTLMHPAEFSYYASRSKPGDAKPVPIVEGDTIDIGGRVFEVIAFAGHTPGSIILLNRAERFIVGGDSILQMVFVFGWQRSIRALIYSLENLKAKYDGTFDKIHAAHFELIMDASHIDKELAAAKQQLAKELKGVDPGFPIPLEPDGKPALLYMGDGCGFFDYAELPYYY